MQWLAAVCLLLQLQLGVAVKSWMFKRCDQNPFCERNRDHAGVPDSSIYRVDAGSIDTTVASHVTGNIIKVLSDREAEVSAAVNEKNEVILPFTLEIVTDDIVHFLVDEKDRQLELEDKALQEKLTSERFDPTDYVLDPKQAHLRKPDSKVQVVSQSENALTIEFGSTQNRVTLEFAPLRLFVDHRGERQVIVNKHDYLNYDHLRRKRPEERNADWEDKFDHYTDRHVRGPESVAVDTSFEGYNSLYGIPEHADSLDLRDTRGKEPYRLFNVDIFEYETNSPVAMYGSIPFITSQKPGHAAGVFWLNAADTYVDIAKEKQESTAHWISETGKLNLYVIVGDTPADVLSSYGVLTGNGQLPQLFSLGYHQCRWNYQTQEELLSVNTKMDEYEFPYDVIWLDIEWSDDRRYFAWDLKKFPDPENMMSELNDTKRKLVVLNDPHIKARNDYEVYTELRENGVLVKDTGGEREFHGHCWPGESTWIDSLNPATWPLWRKFHALGTKLGGYARNLHIWSDMSEPSVFSGSETTAYKGLIHHGGWQHRDVHNIYGHNVFNMTYDALLARYEGTQRPFVLSRSFFAGSQRLGPIWTGDNQAEWDYLRQATPMILTLGVSGYPFTGADVGGFFRNPSDELLARWYQSGIFYPFFRAHAHIESRYREPYLLDVNWRNAVRKAVELRYQLLPQIYTAFWQASNKLQPIMRPLYYEFPDQPELYQVDDQFFLGSALLAKPIVEEGAKSLNVRFPGHDIYYDYFTGGEIDGSEQETVELTNLQIDTIPLYVRGGNIVFRKDRKRRSAELMRNDPYTLLIAVGRDGKASGQLYVDDGITFAYEEADDYLLSDVEFSEGGIKGTVLHQAKGDFADKHIERIIVYGAEATQAEISDGGEVSVEPIEQGFILKNPKVNINENWYIQLR